MTMYKSFKEAALAFPTKFIYVYKGEYSTYTNLPKYDKVCWVYDYCITVNEFLKRGYKFSKGDVIVLDEYRNNQYVIEKPEAWNSINPQNEHRWVLSSDCLQY